jgi:hypothetical protein
MIALIQVTEKSPFQNEAEYHGKRYADCHLQQEMVAEIRRQRKSQVCTEHVKTAVREIDDAHDAENQRQPAGYQKKQQTVLNSVKTLDKKCRKFHGNPES